MGVRPLVSSMINLNFTIGLFLLLASPTLPLPAPETLISPLGQFSLGDLSNEALENKQILKDLLEWLTSILNHNPAEHQRRIKEEQDKEMLHEMLSLPGFHFGQKKKSSPTVNSMTDEEKLKWMAQVLANFETLRSKIPPPRRFGKRAMIGGGSWG